MPGQVVFDHPPPALAVDPFWVARPGAYRVGGDVSSRLTLEATPLGMFEDEEVVEVQRVPEDVDVPLLSAVLVSELPPLVEAIAVPPPKSLRQRLSEAGRRLLPKKARRRPSTDPSQGGDAGQDSSRGSSGESTELPGAYLVERDNENPDAEIVRAAPVAPSRAARLRRLLRRLVRLRFELGESRDVVEAEVQGIQRRIDGIEEESPVVDVEDSPPVVPDRASPVPPEHVGGSSQEPVVISQDPSVALDGINALLYVNVPTKKADKPDPYAKDDRDTKRTWGRSKDDDAAPLPYETGHGSYGGARRISGGVPSWVSSVLRDEVRAASEELERVRLAHQEDLRTAEAEYQRLLAERDAALEEMALKLEAARAENEQRFADLEAKALKLEAAQAENEHRFADKDAELEELVLRLEAVEAESKQQFAAKDAELEEMAVKLKAAQAENEQRVAELEGMALKLDAVQAENEHRVADKDAKLEELALRLKAVQAENTRRLAAKDAELEEMALKLKSALVSSCSETSDCECSESSIPLYVSSIQDDASSVDSCNVSKGGYDLHEMQHSHFFAHEACASTTAATCRRVSNRKEITHRFKRCSSSRFSQAWTQRDFDDAFRRLLEVNYPVTIGYDMNSDTLPEWTYHCNDCNDIWAEGTSICHTFLFSKGAPQNTIADITAGVLQGLINYASKRVESASRSCSTSPASLFRVKEVTCLRTGMLISTETDLDIPYSTIIGDSETGAIEIKESKPKLCEVQIWIALVDASPDSCLEASSRVDPKMQRLIVCAKGFRGEAGEHIWRGGLDVVLTCIRATLNSSFHIDAHEIVCPTCLDEMRTFDSSTWSFEDVCRGGSSTVRCQKRHIVEKILICGTGGRARAPPSLFTRLILSNGLLSSLRKSSSIKVCANVQVLVKDSNGELLEVGSGFVSNKKAGLVVTSGHVLFRGGFVHSPSGRKPQLKPNIRVLISVPCGDSGEEVRYDAELASSDFQNIDACVLRLKKSTAFSPRVQDLKLADSFLLHEYVRLCGFNQGGDGKLCTGYYLDRSLDVVPGVVSKHCNYVQTTAHASVDYRLVDRTGYFPLEEIAISGLSRAIEGHSGGPCINERGEVVGILSRVDFACATRWYITPFTQIRSLIEKLTEA